ncbi:cysteine desulfurase [Paenibacillus sp. N4]|uniref:cysteine desulfurase family protein n=1 Tax=Paenibacillus vietnamensis TaxID=2590547 RepID=UPI001CD16944|nr:cysteine desulfurase family protein [Paenibacillus vietnamensis]MCA0757855.1 cysteine desulfurase [Paenibacillus vietnamensis]
MDGRYFDYNATTPIDPAVAAAMMEHLSEYGNPSSTHRAGKTAKQSVRQARSHAADLLNCGQSELIFTSGGSESNNWAIKGWLSQWKGRRPHIITSSIEHPSVQEAIRYAMREWEASVTWLPVDGDGFLSAEAVAEALRPETKLISIMLANNELGTLQPIRDIARIARASGVFMHTDAVQAVGKINVDVQELGVDALSFSAHKFYGPKGIGGLYLKEGRALEPLVHGGGQESGLRSGTENVLALVGLGEACRLAREEMEETALRLDEFKRLLAAGLTALSPQIKQNGGRDASRTLAGTMNIQIPHIRGEALAAYLDHRFGIALSVGSACSSNREKKLSGVLKAIGLQDAEIQSSVRISMGKYTKRSDIVGFLEAMEQAMEHFCRLMPV